MYDPATGQYCFNNQGSQQNYYNNNQHQPNDPNAPQYSYQNYQPAYPQQYFDQNQQNQQQPRQASEMNGGLPSVIKQIESNKSRAHIYESFKGGESPPFPTSNFTVVDKGCSSPRFVRSTFHIFPSSPSMAKQLAVPLGLIVQPCAATSPHEPNIPIIDHSSRDDLPRCHRCRSYQSPFLSFHNGGYKYLCPFCQSSNDVPETDVSPLDYLGLPSNIKDRPDLQLGSYEYLIKPTICQAGRIARPPVFIFMLDVSYLNINNGLFNMFCSYLKNYVLTLIPRDSKSKSDVGVVFMTYDTKINLYSYSSQLKRPRMITVTDIEDISFPIDGVDFIMKPDEDGDKIESILSFIKSEYGNNSVVETILGPPINLGVQLISSLKGCGRIFVFHSTLPSAAAPGSLQIRGVGSVNKKPTDLLTPQSSYYDKLAEHCSKNACSVELFLFSNTYCDVVTLSPLCNKTGGKLYKYDTFHVSTDGLRFLRDLQMSVSAQNQCYDCSFTVRTSLGLTDVDCYGSFLGSEWGSIRDCAVIDEFSTFALELNLLEKLTESGYVYLQAALVYTDISGLRKLRVHNVAYSVSGDVNTVMTNLDCFALTMMFCKKSLSMTLSKTFEEVETWVIKTIGTSLAQFRKQSTNLKSSTLLLPSPIELFPILCLGFLKMPCFLKHPFNCDDIAVCHTFMLSSSLNTVVPYFYPSIYDLHDEQFMTPESVEILIRSETLKPISCDYRNFSRDRAYFIDSGFRQVLWVGDHVGESWAMDVLGFNSISQIESSIFQKCVLQRFDNFASRGLFLLMDWICGRRSHQPRLLLTKGSGTDQILTGGISDLLVESPGLVLGKSYQHFLVEINTVATSNA